MNFFLLLLVLFTTSAFAQEYERCTLGQIQNTLRLSTNICNEQVNEFAQRSNATCKVSRYDMNVCWAICNDSSGKVLARVRVDMYSDCEREQSYYSKTVIKYYR